MEFYNENIDSIIEQFGSDPNTGLTEIAVQAGRKNYGQNVLKASETRKAFDILLGQFTSPLIILLIATSLASFYLGQQRDGLILLIIVSVNALIGFYQEWKSENILASIKKLVVDKCTAVRRVC